MNEESLDAMMLRDQMFNTGEMVRDAIIKAAVAICETLYLCSEVDNIWEDHDKKAYFEVLKKLVED